MRKLMLLMLAAVFVGGCALEDENPDWNPKKELPSWAYDAPFYYRPTEDLKAVEIVGPGIPIYYPNSEYFFLPHPGGYQTTGSSRIAVWCSTDQENWERCGYFGVEQTHFLMHAEQEGTHWIRFVGPGQGVTKVPPGQPHRIYVVDQTPPAIILSLKPKPYYEDSAGNRKTYIYEVGEIVILRWLVNEPNPKKGTIKLGTCFAKFPHNLIWSAWPKPLATSGTMQIEIPPEAVKDGGLRFRMEATDKAGNVGMAMTEIMNVQGQGKPGPQPSARPVKPSDQVYQTAGTPDKKRPGWPLKGTFFRGGTTRILAWMPESASACKELELRFSSNNGRTWRTLATNLRPGKKIKWTVPKVTSKNCRLRFVGVLKSGKKVTLFMSERFYVGTVGADIIEGPKPAK